MPPHPKHQSTYSHSTTTVSLDKDGAFVEIDVKQETNNSPLPPEPTCAIM